MKYRLACASLILSISSAAAVADTSVLFIGNSFTYGAYSPVRFYRSDSVTDLNNEGIGGMPALFKSFVDQAGLDYDVFLETRGGSGLDFHFYNKHDVIGSRGWDVVVMHGYSTLDRDKPRDPAKLIDTSRQMTELLRAGNAAVKVYLMATWSRADETYQDSGAWAGEPIHAMATDVRAAYDAAAEAVRAAAVIPVGEAWNRAMASGVADPNPYDGIEADKVNLWTYDHYHASTYGLYLEALVVFGTLTGRDPRALGAHECSAWELGISGTQTVMLQQIAWEQLVSEGAVGRSAASIPPASPQRCAAPAR
jgi:hypothetical protein